MKKLLVISLGFLLSACGQDGMSSSSQAQHLEAQKNKVPTTNEPMTPTETIKAIDDSLAKVSGQDNKKVTFSTQKFDYKMPKDVADKCVAELPENWDENDLQCPIVDITLAKIEPRWIEDIMRREMTGDDNPKLIKFSRDIDEFVRSQIDEGISLGYSRSIVPEYLGMHNQLAQFAVTHDTYLGGAHGLAVTNYYVFDTELQSQITLEDVQNSEQLISQELMEQAYRDYLHGHQMSGKEIEDHMKNYPIEYTDNFYFNDEGLVLSYAPYHLGPYVMGTVEVVITYDKLGGIIREEYLPKNTQSADKLKAN